MNESRIRAWLWVAAAWVGVLIPSAYARRNSIELFMMSAFVTGLGAVVLVGVVGGYYRNWFVTLLGAPLLLIAMGLAENIQGTLAGRNPIDSLFPTSRTDVAEFTLLIVLMLVVSTLSHLLMARRQRHRIPPGHCRKCGYNLTDNVSGICPECGTKINSAETRAP